MIALSRLYGEGKDVERDEKQAMEWLEKACSLDTLGSNFACGEISKDYFEGELGLSKDNQKAFEYAIKAANKGNPDGAHILQQLKGNGFIFTDADKERALVLISKANDEKYWLSRFAEQALETLQD